MLVYIIHDVVIVLLEMLWVYYVRRLASWRGGEENRKREGIHLFGGRGEVDGEGRGGGGAQGRNLNVWGGEERRISPQKVSLHGYGFYAVYTANRYVFPLWCSPVKSVYQCHYSDMSNGKTE